MRCDARRASRNRPKNAPNLAIGSLPTTAPFDFRSPEQFSSTAKEIYSNLVYSSKLGGCIGPDNRYFQNDARNRFWSAQARSHRSVGLDREGKREKKKSHLPTKRCHPRIWRTLPCFRAATAGSVSKAFRSRFPSPVVTASCWPATLRSSCAIAREQVRGGVSARSRPRSTTMSLSAGVVAHRRQSSVGPSVSIAPA